MITSDAAAIAIGVLVLGWILPSISLVPSVARARLGSWASFFGWMIVSLLFSPILALLALVFRDRVELPDPIWLPVQVGAAALLGLAWTNSAEALARRFRFWQKHKSSKLKLPS